MIESTGNENLIKLPHERKRKIALKKYADEKIHILTEEFYLRLTDMEIRHFYELDTDCAIDAYSRYLIVSKL